MGRGMAGQRKNLTEKKLDKEELDREKAGQRKSWTEEGLDRGRAGQSPLPEQTKAEEVLCCSVSRLTWPRA